MKGPGFVWVMLAFAVVVLAAGFPYWRIPYDELNRGHFAILPGALLLGFLTFILVVTKLAPARRTAYAMLCCVPVIVCISIAKDTARDPTSHNLWPFEFVFAAIAGAAVVMPAMLLGLALRWVMARVAAR
jgi:sugar phosphate permease